jgi:RNA polymerase sigma factor (TIGR02999 family)
VPGLVVRFLGRVFVADSNSMHLTQLLVRWSEGNHEALDSLMPLVYAELRRLAAVYIRKETPGHTLQSAALVNEAYLRLIDQNRVHWQSRAHFFAIASQMMRRILVDHTRARLAAKRGAGPAKLSLSDVQPAIGPEQSVDLIALDSALNKLSQFDPQQSRIIELRFFGGLSIEETAEVLQISPATVKRDWTVAKGWLFRELSTGGANGA